VAENDYDAFAAAYDADNEVNAWNAYYERPAKISALRLRNRRSRGPPHRKLCKIVRCGEQIINVRLCRGE
jgi:hypothetical protein